MIFPVRFPIISVLLISFHALSLAQSTDTVAPVEFSSDGGIFSGSLTLELSCPTPGAAIRYTFNGEEPDSLSLLYDGTPLSLSATKVVRARAFTPGMTPSAVATQSYIIGQNHTFPVVSLAFEPDAFFDPLTGIYIQYFQDLSALANVEFFENGANIAAFNQPVEVEIQGTGSTSQPQKSLEIKAKKSLGAEEVPYALFPELPFDTYKRFVLRSGGQDWCVLQFRDEFAVSLLADLSDIGSILRKPALYLQAWRPAVVYLNGQYWGIHNVRERMNRFYVRQHFGWEENEFDLIENYNEVQTGDFAAWLQLFNFLWQPTQDFSNDSVFSLLKQQIDYDNYLDYCAFAVYLENEDWPGKNVTRFRHRSADGKWKWMTYDLDFTFGLYQAGGGWNTGDPSPNALARLLDDSSTVWPNPDWSTLLFRRLWQNAGFRRDFANRLADMLNTAFLPQRVGERLNFFRTLYAPEIPRHYERWWGGNFNTVWLDNIEKTRYFATHRPDFVRREVLQAMSEADTLATLTVDVDPPGSGRVEISTLSPEAAQLPWSGIYFANVPVPVKAIANPGYEFLYWSNPKLGAADSTGLLLQDSMVLVAHFQAIDTITTGVKGTPGIRPLSITPNPVGEAMSVCGEIPAGAGCRVAIRNATGETLLQTRIMADPGSCLHLEIPGWPAGIYFLQLTTEKGRVVQPFVVKGK